MRDKLFLVSQSVFLHGVNILAGLGFSVACARLMPAETYGELRYIMTWMPILMAFSLPGYDSVILRNTNLRLSVPLLKIFTIRFVGACAGSLLILIALMKWPDTFNDTQRFFFLCVALSLPFFETGTGYKNYLIATHLKKQGLRLGIQARAATLILLITSIAFLYFYGYRPLYFLPAYLIAMVLPTLVVFLYVAVRQIQFSRSKKPPSVFLRQAIGFTAASMIGTITYSLDKLMIRHEMGAQDLAYYAILTMVPLELAKMIDSILPVFYRRLFLERAKTPRLLFALTGGGILLSMSVYITLFYLFSSLVFGDFYTYSLPMTGLSSLLIFSMTTEYYCYHHMIARRGSHAILVFSAVNLLVSSALFWGALHFFGIFGLMIVIIIKQISVPPLFIRLTRKIHDGI